MAYCLDADSLIDAKNHYYGMDFCPAFWMWLDVQAKAGEVLSIVNVADELEPYGGALKTWGEARKGPLFKGLDAKVAPWLTELSEWTMKQHYLESAKNEFLGSTDLKLIAFAKAHGHTVVTREVHEDGKKKVKIPTVCKAFDVDMARTHEMLRKLNARFVLEH
jgi:hypothetical protein